MQQKIIAHFIFLLLCITFWVVVSDTARGPQDGDYTYNINAGVAIITKYTGTGGDITIPSSLGGHLTTVIDEKAFFDCDTLLSVIIPDVVTTIQTSAFASCSSLTSVTIGSGVTTINDTVFDSCTSLTSITFLGLATPSTVGSNWIQSTPPGVRGHAYIASNFPAPGDSWNGLTMGAYINSPPPSNSPPVIGTPSPGNGSTGNLLSLSWSIQINDPEGNIFSWTLQCTNGQTNSGIGESNGTKSLSLSGLASLTTYTIWVNATDPAGSNQYTRIWYTFTTQETLVNTPPVCNTPSPTNESTGNPTSLTWHIPINDPEGDTFTWSIECNNGQSSSDTVASNGTKSLLLSSLTYATAYTIWVNATDPDGSKQSTCRWYTFTTVTSLGAPSNLNAQNPTSTSIALSWTKGSTSEYTIIRRSTNGYPTSPTSGTQAYYGTGTSTTDSSLSNGQRYYYRAWTYSNSTDQYSSGYTSDTEYTLPATPSSLTAYNPTETSISLSWSKGTGSEYTMIRRNTGSYPSSPTSGTQAYYGTATSVTDAGLLPGTYYYRAWAQDSDSKYYSSGSSQDYETIAQPKNSPPVYGIPSPENLSTNTPINLTWSIPINDPNGNSFSWTIHCSNRQQNSGTTATNGTKSLSLSGLTYATTYTIWVNATDPTGSGNYTRNWYTFTTKLSSEGGGSNSADSANKKPIAATSASEPYKGFVDSELLFNGSASYDPDGTITRYEWSFGDNTTAIGVTPTHTYQKEGNYTVTLIVTDNNGSTTQHTTYALITIPQNNPPNQPYLTGPSQGTITTQINLTIYTTDPENHDIYYTIYWNDDTNITKTNVVPSNTTIPVTHQWTKPGIYTIKAYATDNHYATSETIQHTILINIQYVDTIGYLSDTHNNGTYNTFYSNTTKNITLVQYNNNIYLIDTDDDGTFDHQYNIVTGKLNSYSAEQPTSDQLPSTTVILLAAIAASILVTLTLMTNKKRKKQAPIIRTLEEEANYLHDKWNIDTPNRTKIPFNEIHQKINQHTIANNQFNTISSQIDAPKTDPIRFRLIQPQADISEITTTHFKEISHNIDSQTRTDSHLQKIEQKIDTSKITNQQDKEIHQKIDELIRSNKESHTQ